MDHQNMIDEDLKMTVGLGATHSNGRDSYPYYVSEVLPNRVIGIYHPQSRFDDTHSWEGGTMVVDPFDKAHPTERYIKRFYGKWWECTREGKRIKHFDYGRLTFGHASSHQDPSF